LRGYGMLVFPEDKPVIENLNSYYVDTTRLIEHYQGELGSGMIRFKASSAEAVVIFDQDQVLNACFRDRNGEVDGDTAMEIIGKRAGHDNFIIGVYAVDSMEAYFWAGLSSAERLYSDLSTEFTDLEGLMRKMRSEGLSGYIRVHMGDGEAGGLIFFISGDIIGTCGSTEGGLLDRSLDGPARLVRETRASGAVFHVSRISQNGQPEGIGKPGEGSRDAVFEMIASMLRILERLAVSEKKVRGGFGTALKRKFVQKAEQYPFLRFQ